MAKKIDKAVLIQFIKFGLVGVSNTLISYGIYSLMVYCGIYYLIASVVSFIVSVLNSFFWNNKYVFKMHANEKRNIWRALLKTFIAYGITGLVLQNILLFIMVDRLGLSKYLSPLLILIITVPLNFIINKFWAFKSTQTDGDDGNEQD